MPQEHVKNAKNAIFIHIVANCFVYLYYDWLEGYYCFNNFTLWQRKKGVILFLLDSIC